MQIGVHRASARSVSAIDSSQSAENELVRMQ